MTAAEEGAAVLMRLLPMLILFLICTQTKQFLFRSLHHLQIQREQTSGLTQLLKLLQRHNLRACLLEEGEKEVLVLLLLQQEVWEEAELLVLVRLRIVVALAVIGVLAAIAVLEEVRQEQGEMEEMGELLTLPIQVQVAGAGQEQQPHLAQTGQTSHLVTQMEGLAGHLDLIQVDLGDLRERTAH